MKAGVSEALVAAGAEATVNQPGWLKISWYAMKSAQLAESESCGLSVNGG
jgi:hypothetical protein